MRRVIIKSLEENPAGNTSIRYLRHWVSDLFSGKIVITNLDYYEWRQLICYFPKFTVKKMSDSLIMEERLRCRIVAHGQKMSKCRYWQSPNLCNQ